MTSQQDIPPALTAGQPRRPYVIAVFNQKGGVAKTTTSTNLAICLAALNRSVTLIDLDSQGNATSSLGLTPAPLTGAYQALMGEAATVDVLSSTIYPKLTLMASSEALSSVDFDLALTDDPAGALDRFLKSGEVPSDYVVIDCPPTFSMVPVNALVAADAVVIPVHPSPLAHDGLIKAWGNIKRIQARMNRNLTVHGLLLTMMGDGETEQSMEQVIRQEFGNKVYDTVIPRDERVTDAAVKDIPVTVFDPSCKATRAYIDFAEEFILREPILRHHRTPGGEDENVRIRPFREDEHKDAIDAALRTIAVWHEQIKHADRGPDFLEASQASPPTLDNPGQWANLPEAPAPRTLPFGAFLAGALIVVAFITGFVVGSWDAITQMLTQSP